MQEAEVQTSTGLKVVCKLLYGRYYCVHLPLHRGSSHSPQAPRGQQSTLRRGLR